MTYTEFQEIIASRIKEYLPERYSDASVSITPVLKNNGLTLDALCIRLESSNICPNIYLNDFYQLLENGRTLEDILSEIANIRLEHEDCPDLDTAAITDFQRIKDKIKVKLINATLNADYLVDKPHTVVADLAAVYFLELASCDSGTMTTVITDALLERYGMSVDELNQIAISNLEKEPRFTSMTELILGLDLPEYLIESVAPTEESMFVLTNASRQNGSGMVLSCNAMDSVAEKIGTDFFILPSSIHELILVPSRAGMDSKELEQMVRTVNATKVAPHEFLSDHVYTYDFTHHELRLAV